MAIEIPLIQDSSKNDAATESKTSVMEVSIPVESNITDSTDIYVEPVFPSQTESSKTSLRLLIDSNSLLASEFKNNPEYTLNSPMIMEDDEEYEAAWTMGNHTVAEAPDISIPKVSSGRRESAIQLGFNKSVLFMRRSNPFIGPPNAIGIQKKGGQESLQKRSMSLTVSKVEDIIPSGINNRRRTEFTIPITSLLPSGPVHVHRPTRVQAPPGIITRFTVPVPKDDLAKIVPKTYRGHRRSLSYQNAVSASGTPASFEEWVRMVHQEKGQIKDREMSETGDEYDVVKPFSQTPKTPTRMGGRDFKLATIVDETAIQVNSPEGVPDGNMKLLNSDGLPRENFKTSKMMNDDKEDQDLDLDIIIYDAFLIATDNDFLESSKIRALFRENAIVPDDAKLFEMPAYTGEQQSSPTVEIVEDSLLCEWCYPSSQVLSQTTPCIRAFHRAKKIRCYASGVLPQFTSSIPDNTLHSSFPSSEMLYFCCTFGIHSCGVYSYNSSSRK
ncbi:hypothetical protein BASA81_018193 [Batrachochytrium salamandrivorans]|nr:hypothetical protein BASA81_018193 [Batrachochytrium salamandrivorans]